MKKQSTKKLKNKLIENKLMKNKLMKKEHRKRIINIGQWLIGLIILGFFAQRLWGSLDELGGQALTFSWGYALASLGIFLLGLGMMILSWWLLLRGLGARPTLTRTAVVWTRAEITKYIPGVVWPMVGKVMAIRPKGAVTMSIAVDILFKILASSLVGILLLPWARERLPVPLIVGGIVLLLIILHPKVIEFFANFYFRIRKKPRGNIVFSYGHSLLAFTAMVIVWLLIGAGFWLFAGAIAPTLLATEYATLLIGGFCASWVIGYLFIFIPSGIGVREGLLAVLLTPGVGEPTAIVIALAGRIWWMVGDGIAYGLSFLGKKN